METNAESRNQVEIPPQVTEKRRTKVPSSSRCSKSSRQHVTAAFRRIKFLRKRMWLEYCNPSVIPNGAGIEIGALNLLWTYSAAERKEKQEEPKTARPKVFVLKSASKV